MEHQTLALGIVGIVALAAIAVIANTANFQPGAASHFSSTVGGSGVEEGLDPTVPVPCSVDYNSCKTSCKNDAYCGGGLEISKPQLDWCIENYISCMSACDAELAACQANEIGDEKLLRTT